MTGDLLPVPAGKIESSLNIRRNNEIAKDLLTDTKTDNSNYSEP